MAFRPTVNSELEIDGKVYLVAEHPAAPGIPYGQEGRQGVVFQLCDSDGVIVALKVFKQRFRAPALVTGATRLVHYADIPGLAVCARTVLTPRQHAQLLRVHPDLTYAVLMPWMSGPSWIDCVLDRRALTLEQSLQLARALADLLATMEERGIAHGDLSGPNLLLPSLATPPAEPMVALVDVEQLYAPGMDRPEQILSGSSGYAHSTTAQGVWGATSDRFAGAVLLAEILAWSDAEIRQASGEESYFEPEELQQAGRQYDLLRQSLKRRWGADIARLLERAWQSATLADCPTFGEWLVTLPEVASPEPAVQAAVMQSASVESRSDVQALLELGSMLREQGNRDGALVAYQQAIQHLSPKDGLAAEIRLLMEDLEGPFPHGADQVTASSGRKVAPAVIDNNTSNSPAPHTASLLLLTGMVVLICTILLNAGIFFNSRTNLPTPAIPPIAEQPTATPMPQQQPTAGPTEAPAAAAPAAGGGSAVEEGTAELTLDLLPAPVALAFAETELTIPADTLVTLNFNNQNDLGVQHNWVLVDGDTAVADRVNTAASGNAAELFVPPDDTEGALAWTAMLNVGDTDSVTFRTPTDPGTYLYICTFPGHYLAGMIGEFVVE